MTTNQSAMIIRSLGGPDVFEAVERQLEEPERGEMLVRHTAVGVNFIDVYHRTGAFPLPSLPAVLGVDGVGVVESLGPGVAQAGFSVGDRVAYIADSPGSYASARVVAAKRAVHLPESLGDDAAAALLFRAVTAHMLVQKTYSVRPGDVVLVHAAHRGVAGLVCQWARHLGATVIATVSRAERVEGARENGAEHVIVLGAADVAAEVRKLTEGLGVNAVFDGVGLATFAASLASVRPFGVVASFGQSSGALPPVDPLQLGPRRSIVLARPGVFAYTADPARLTTAATEALALAARGVLAARVGATFPLDHAAQAHRAFEQGKMPGAILLVP